MTISNSTISAITELVFLEQTIDKADVIFVFGNDWIATMDEVAILYQKGVAKIIVISGHSAKADREKSEARRFLERGLELGISKDAMLLEERATNTKENILNSLPIMERSIAPRPIASVLFVCKTFHTRRVLMTARNLLSPDVQYGFLPVGDERNITRENWWQDADRQERVIAEVRRIAEYTLKGDLSVQ
jgi:uncharacterized SAM-binding protein YcdF (DUF218 family)